MNRRIGMLAAGIAGALAVGVVGACSSQTEEVTHYNPGGNDSGLDSTTGGDSGDDDSGLRVPVCDVLGGYAAVQKLTRDAIAKLSADCRIGPYFTAMTDTAKQHHQDCFETFLAASVECTNGGAKIIYAGSKDSRGVACKTITNAHGPLTLTRDDHRAFVEDFVAVMNAQKVPTNARDGIVSVLNGTQGVYANNKTGNKMCNATCAGCVVVDAGTDADASTDASDAATEAGPVDSGGGG